MRYEIGTFYVSERDGMFLPAGWEPFGGDYSSTGRAYVLARRLLSEAEEAELWASERSS